MRPTFGQRSRCPACSTMLPEPESREVSCPRCSAHLWPVRFQTAGLRFLIAPPVRSLDDVLHDLLAPHNPELAESLRTARMYRALDLDSLDFLELRLEVCDQLERILPELADRNR